MFVYITKENDQIRAYKVLENLMTGKTKLEKKINEKRKWFKEFCLRYYL